MIRHLTYVGCDGCGDPAQPGDDATDARAIARGEGWNRVQRRSRTQPRDLCPKCDHGCVGRLLCRVCNPSGY